MNRDDTIAPAEPRASGTVTAWIAASAVAAVGAWLCWAALPGINWAIFTAVASAGLAGFARARAGRWRSDVMMPLALGCVVAGGVALTDNEFLVVLSFAACVSLLAVATLVAGGADIERMGARALAGAPWRAFTRTLREAASRSADVFEATRGDQSSAVLRGGAIATPVVIVFGLLLATADPVFASVFSEISALMANWSWMPRTVFFGGLGALSLGAYGLALRPLGIDAFSHPRDAIRPRFTIGETERTIVLGSVVALFAAFLLLQVSYLFGNLAAVNGSGVTFAEHARQGFAEITITATLATLLIIGLDRLRTPNEVGGRARTLSLVLVCEVQLLLASAYRRVDLYADAYGYTVDRLFAQAYMICAALALLLLLHEIIDGIDFARLARRVALVAVAGLIALSWWNHAAWIAERNLERFHATGKLDVHHLTQGLAWGGVPTVVAALPGLPKETADGARACLSLAAGRAGVYRWYEWNGSRMSALEALRSAGVQPLVWSGSESSPHGCR